MLTGRRQTKCSGNREVVGWITPIDVVIQDCCFEYSDRRRCEDIIDLIAFSGSPEAVAGSNIFGIGMQHAKRIDHWNRIVRFASILPTEGGPAFQIRYNRIVFAGVEIACYDKWVFVLSMVNMLSQQYCTFFAGRLGNVVQVKVKDIKSSA